MKTAFISITSALLLAGCCTNNYPQGQAYTTAGSSWSVVNNTGYPIDVFRNGKPLGKLEVGQVLPIPFGLFQPEVAVTVVGHTPSGEFIGSSSHHFFSTDTDVWTVLKLYTPQPSN